MIAALKKTVATAALIIGCNASISSAQVTTIADPSLNDRISLVSYAGPVSGSIDMASGKSRVLQFDTAVGHTMLADPSIADLIPMTDQSIYVLGKNKGTTSLTLFGKEQNLLGVFDLNVSHDLAGLKQRLYQVAPNERIEVRSNGDSIILGGQVSDPSVAATAVRMAEQIAPGKVLNIIASPKSQQVMLRVKIAEVQRSTSKALGLSTNAFFNNGAETLSFLSGVLNPSSFAAGSAQFQLGEVNMNMFFDALEEKGVLSTLAEPTLVAVSGETANFLAGGEFPIPSGGSVVIAEDGASDRTVRIQFKEFGVKLAYTPTIIGDTISLVIAPEVSVLDPANGIQANGFVIPALVTRRAKTTIELKNGQSFAIAGLLQETFEDNVAQIPWFGNIPIIGALARSSDYQKRKSELVIIVTPYIVEPHEGSDYTLPTDNLVMPSESEIFINGEVEGPGANSTGYNASNTTAKLAASEQGTMDGSVGYIVE
ncbi:MAG: type II and III secretion system protein family protein [Hyphomonadaceae bacterium]|nr:type II and III secretion system protein family protein [Hyphomonadaceae bacterium]